VIETNTRLVRRRKNAKNQHRENDDVVSQPPRRSHFEPGANNEPFERDIHVIMSSRNGKCLRSKSYHSESSQPLPNSSPTAWRPSSGMLLIMPLAPAVTA
jgi:hypothetical protein